MRWCHWVTITINDWARARTPTPAGRPTAIRRTCSRPLGHCDCSVPAYEVLPILQHPRWSPTHVLITFDVAWLECWLSIGWVTPGCHWGQEKWPRNDLFTFFILESFFNICFLSQLDIALVQKCPKVFFCLFFPLNAAINTWPTNQVL